MLRPALALTSLALLSVIDPATGGTKPGCPAPHPPAHCPAPIKIVIEQPPPEVTFAPAPPCSVQAPCQAPGRPPSVQCFPFSIPGPPQVVHIPSAPAMAYAPPMFAAPAPAMYAPAPAMAYAPAAPMFAAPAMPYAPAPAAPAYAPAAPMLAAPAPCGSAGLPGPQGLMAPHPAYAAAHAPSLANYGPLGAAGLGGERPGPSPESLLAAQQAFQRTLEEKELIRENAAIAQRQQAVTQRLQGFASPASQSMTTPQGLSGAQGQATKKPETVQEEIDALRRDLKQAQDLIKELREVLKNK